MLSWPPGTGDQPRGRDRAWPTGPQETAEGFQERFAFQIKGTNVNLQMYLVSPAGVAAPGAGNAAPAPLCPRAPRPAPQQVRPTLPAEHAAPVQPPPAGASQPPAAKPRLPLPWSQRRSQRAFQSLHQIRSKAPKAIPSPRNVSLQGARGPRPPPATLLLPGPARTCSARGLSSSRASPRSEMLAPHRLRGSTHTSPRGGRLATPRPVTQLGRPGPLHCVTVSVTLTASDTFHLLACRSPPSPHRAQDLGGATNMVSCARCCRFPRSRVPARYAAAAGRSFT